MNILTYIVALLIVLGLLVWGMFEYGNREIQTAEAFRSGSGYSQAALSKGVTAYRIEGPEDGPAVIIVHGATLGSVAYQGYVPPLVAAGYRVVIYDQYGRGFSDRPSDGLTIDLLQGQLLELMDYLDLQQAHLFGVSLGGAVIARFAAANPTRAHSLAYQVPLIEGASVTPALLLARLPIVGSILARFVAIPAIIERGESFGTDTQAARDVVAHFKAQFLVQGTERMMRQMLSGDALSNRLPDHLKIGASGMRAQFAYALDDLEIAAAQVEQAISLYQDPDVATYMGGHFFSSGRTEELAVKLDQFFKSQPSQ